MIFVNPRERSRINNQTEVQELSYNLTKNTRIWYNRTFCTVTINASSVTVYGNSDDNDDADDEDNDDNDDAIDGDDYDCDVDDGGKSENKYFVIKCGG